MKKNRIHFIVLLCVLLAALPLTASAAARMPELRGTVTDDANVLPAETVSLLNEAAETIEAAYQLKLRVVIVHFLDGMPVQRYTDELFSQREVDENTLLLLCAAGEDCCAVHYGSKVSGMLGASNLDRLLLDSGMSAKWEEQQYEQSMYAYLESLLELCKRQNSGNLAYVLPTAAVHQVNTVSQTNADSVWSGLVPGATPKPYASDTWAGLHQSAEEAAKQDGKDEKSGGLSFGEWVLVIVLVLIVISQSDPVRRARGARSGSYRRYGCGCSPLGWIVSLFGLNVLFDRLIRRR